MGVIHVGMKLSGEDGRFEVEEVDAFGGLYMKVRYLTGPAAGSTAYLLQSIYLDQARFYLQQLAEIAEQDRRQQAELNRRNQEERNRRRAEAIASRFGVQPIPTTAHLDLQLATL